MNYKFKVGDLVEMIGSGYLALVTARRRQAPVDRPNSPEEIYTLLFTRTGVQCDKVGHIMRKAGESNEV